VDRQTFLEHVRQSRLLPEGQVAGLVARFGEDVPAQDLAGKLVEEGVLTRYQAQQIWAGKTRGLALGQYHILDKLGEGGFGQVYKALHTLMDRQVAIKIISPELIQDSRAREWFRREVLATTQLSHPNIVLAYDANEVDDVLFLVMEYVEGTNLDAFVKAQGPLPVLLAGEMMRQAALGLQHAHEKGMVHRDIKPANLLIAQGAASARVGAAPVLVKVVDFGLARLQQTAKAGTLMLQNDKAFLGTPDYVSPEQARDMHAVDIRSDLYSLGCTFYYALTARRPFHRTTLLEVVVQHLEQDPEPLEACRPDVPEPVRAIVRRLMAKEPGERFQTPAELVAALAPWSLADPPQAGPPLPATGADLGWEGCGDRLAPATAGATALLPKLAFWDGPALSRSSALEPASGADPTPALGNNGPAATRVIDPPPAESPSPTWVTRGVGAGPEAPAAAGQGEAPRAAEAAPPFRANDDLRRCWRRWVAVVEAFVRDGRVEVSEVGYRVLHGRLLEHCRAPAGVGGARPAVLQRLESLVEPWLTPRNLAATDRQTLASLLLQCAELDRELGGRERRSLWPAAVVAAVLVLALAGGWYASHLQGWASAAEPTADWVRDLIESRPVLFLAAAVPAVVLAVLFGLSRLLRA
jgi:eukaryotic-like serine/threonine-protein kinase